MSDVPHNSPVTSAGQPQLPPPAGGGDPAARRSLLRTLRIFGLLLVVAVFLIVLGRRNDAVTQAQIYHAGVITADEVNVSFENVGGRLLESRVNEGDLVQKGDVLMTIDDRDYQIALRQDQSKLRNIEAQIAKKKRDIEIESAKVDTTEENSWRQIEELQSTLSGEQATLTQARADFSRYEQLLGDRAVSRADYDRARSTFLKAQAAVDSTIHSLEAICVGASMEDITRLREHGTAVGMHLNAIANAREAIASEKLNLKALEASRDEIAARIEQDELNLARTTIRAPGDGRILDVMFEEGEMVPPSAPAVLLETSRQYFKVYVAENLVVRLHEGEEISAWSPALEREFSGIIRYIRAAPSFADLRMSRESGQADLTSFEVRIDLRPDPVLIPGLLLEIGH